MFYKLVYYSIRKCSYAWLGNATFVSVARHSPNKFVLCARLAKRSPCSVATRDSLSKLSLSTRCSVAFQAVTCIFLSFKHLHSPLWLRRRLAAARDSLSKLSLSARCSRAFHTLACIFLSFKHLHSPLCACLQDRNLLRDSSKTVSS